MSDRGLTLLSLCALPVNDPERRSIWLRILEWPSVDEPHLQSQMKDYARRHWITTEDYLTAELTHYGKERYQRGLDLRAGRS